MSRPTKYTDDMDQRAFDCLKEGRSIVSVCVELDISRETLYQWIDEKGDYYKPSFSDTIKRGLEHSQSWWEEEGRKGLKERNFQAALWFGNMKNRFSKDWKDKQEVEQTVTEHKVIKPPKLEG